MVKITQNATERRKMYTSVNNYEGMGPRLYRTPDEIRADMFKISGKIRESGEMLSVHHLLSEMVAEYAQRTPEEWIPALEEMVCEARDTLEELQRLGDRLDELKEELMEVRCAWRS